MTRYFYYQADGGVYGPVSEEQLIEAGRSSKVTGDTIAKEADDAHWTTVRALIPDWKDAPPHIPVGTSTASSSNNGSFSLTRVLQVAIFGAIGAGAVWYYNQNYTGFTEQELRRMTSSIEERYRARPGFTNVSAVMLRKSRTEAFGHVNFRVGGIEASHKCSAQMSDTNGQYLWRCEP